MNYKKRILYAAIILILLYVANIFVSTGYFRTIENKFEGRIIKKVHLPGAEDIVVVRQDSFAIISSTKGRALPKVNIETGGLYYIDLKDKNYKPILLSENFKKQFAPHGISIYKKDSSYTIAAINHTEEGEYIEIFNLKNEKLTHQKSLENELIFSPNDLVLLDENRFYFTNDHKYKDGLMRLAEDYLGLSISNVVYFDGNNYTEVADGIAYANGINFDTKRNLLFVASPRGFLVKVYQKNEDNTLTFIEDIDCKTGVDNIEFDVDGKLWIGSHPNLLHFAAYAKGDKKISPSEIITIDYRNKGDYSIEHVYMEDGTEMSASTVAATLGNTILVGNVMDDKFLILETNKK